MKQAPPTANPTVAPPAGVTPVTAEPQTMWDQIFSGLAPGSIGLPTFPQAAPQQQEPNQSAFGALSGTNSPMSLEASRALTESG